MCSNSHCSYEYAPSMLREFRESLEKLNRYKNTLEQFTNTDSDVYKDIQNKTFAIFDHQQGTEYPFCDLLEYSEVPVTPE